MHNAIIGNLMARRRGSPACLAGPVWTQRVLAAPGNPYLGICYDSLHALWFAIAYDPTIGNNPQCEKTADGITWAVTTTQPSNSGSGNTSTNITAGGGVVVVSWPNINGFSWTTDAGVTWTQSAFFSDLGGFKSGVAYGLGVFIGGAFGSKVGIFNSTTLAFTLVAIAFAPQLMAFDGIGTFVVNDGGANTAFSVNSGASWTAGGAIGGGFGTGADASVGANGIVMFADSAGILARSIDGGVTFTTSSPFAGARVWCMIYAQGVFMAVVKGDQLYTSVTGAVWVLSANLLPNISANALWSIANDGGSRYAGVMTDLGAQTTIAASGIC